jgi:hypothetical protein
MVTPHGVVGQSRLLYTPLLITLYAPRESIVYKDVYCCKMQQTAFAWDICDFFYISQGQSPRPLL